MIDNDSNLQAQLVDCSNDSFSAYDPDQFNPAGDWSPILIPRETIDREIERLADLPRPACGWAAEHLAKVSPRFVYAMTQLHALTLLRCRTIGNADNMRSH